MSSVQLRTDPAQPDTGTEHLLDFFSEPAGSTIQYERSFLSGLSPSPVARDLFRLGAAVFCTDKLVSRYDTPDGWGREISLSVPVSDPTKWTAAKDPLVRALRFLSGDEWDPVFVQDTVERPDQMTVAMGDAVSLFSGGLDSLAGVIDLAESGRRLVLVGHHDSAKTDNAQTDLFQRLVSHYGPDRLTHRRLLLRPAGAHAGQARPLAGVSEITTRSRSFLFLSAGIAIADALGPGTPLYVPENGFIGINVPLTASRTGSLSTRTTHPLFMSYMAQLLDMLGLDHAIENPFRLMTKGEALQASTAPAVLCSVAGASVSCAHPEAARWRELDQGNCGYCYPCLIRRAAMHTIGADAAADYTFDALTDARLLRRDWDSGADLRSLAYSLGQPERRMDVLANGRIPGGEAPAFFGVYRRGREELRGWMSQGSQALRRRMGAA